MDIGLKVMQRVLAELDKLAIEDQMAAVNYVEQRVRARVYRGASVGYPEALGEKARLSLAAREDKDVSAPPVGVQRTNGGAVASA